MELSYYERHREQVLERARTRYADPVAGPLIRERNAKYRATPEAKEKASRYQLLHKFGLTQGQYDELLFKQGGGCAICGGPQTGRGRFHVDHDHKTGEVRGLLCHGCNTGIGNLGENPARLEKAAAYLRQHGGTRG
jgi:hypothetical protein